MPKQRPGPFPAPARGAAPAATVTLEPRPWYNVDYNSRWFFVPGVIATLTLVMVVNLTSFAVVREREVGTLEQIMVTPIRPLEFILGKMIPFFCVGLALTVVIALVGTLWFQIPFVGNPFVLLLGTSLYLLSVLGIGLLISTVCLTQQQAFATNFFVINPAFILSGFSFPIASMPVFHAMALDINPMSYYLIVIRGTFLKGVGLDVLWPQMLALAVLGFRASGYQRLAVPQVSRLTPLPLRPSRIPDGLPEKGALTAAEAELLRQRGAVAIVEPGGKAARTQVRFPPICDVPE